MSTLTNREPPPGMSIDTALKVAGFSGCNRFFGQVEVTEESKFRITAMGSTKMACIQDDQATVESVMTKSLQKWNSIALENNILTLTSEQHILTFMPEAVTSSESPPNKSGWFSLQKALISAFLNNRKYQTND